MASRMRQLGLKLEKERSADQFAAQVERFVEKQIAAVRAEHAATVAELESLKAKVQRFTKADLDLLNNMVLGREYNWQDVPRLIGKIEDVLT